MRRARFREQSIAIAGIERRFLRFVGRHSLQLLRWSLVVVFVWFGLLTVTGTSDTAGVVAAVFGSVPGGVVFGLLGGLELAIGAALSLRRTVRLAVVLVVVYTVVTLIPLVVIPATTFAYVPYGPSFEGAYAIKTLVLLGGAMTVGGLLESTANDTTSVQ